MDMVHTMVSLLPPSESGPSLVELAITDFGTSRNPGKSTSSIPIAFVSATSLANIYTGIPST
jgi:hypothetical protein